MHSVDAAGLGIGDDHPPRVMGVLNVSDESPYDPSVFDDPAEAAAYVDEELIGEGADVVDVGLESANKRFETLSAEQELERLDTAVATLEAASGDAVWSIETRYSEVAAAALDRGFDMVNDVAGFADPAMPDVCRERDVAVVKMASPPDLSRPGAVEETPWTARRSAEWAAGADYVDQVYEALLQNGLTDKTIVDPAFGGWSAAKTLADDRETFRRLREFRGLDRPVLVSINRKNFLRELTGRSTDAALPVSLAATSMAVERGAHVVRTHDVAETVDAVAVGDAFARERIRATVDVDRPTVDGDRPAGDDGRTTGNDGRTNEDDGGASGAHHDVAELEVAESDVGELVVEELDVTTRGEARRHFERLGVEDDPGGAVARVYELRGRDPALAERLRTAANEVGCRFVPGTAGAAPRVDTGSDGDGGWVALLYGTVESVARLSARSDVPAPLQASDARQRGGER